MMSPAFSDVCHWNVIESVDNEFGESQALSFRRYALCAFQVCRLRGILEVPWPFCKVRPQVIRPTSAASARMLPLNSASGDDRRGLMSSHTMMAFDADLSAIRSQVIDMGGRVRTAVENGIMALCRNRFHAARGRNQGH